MIDQPQGEMPEGPPRASNQPALTVVIQSWWTPTVAVIALVVGLLAGYFGRPLINNSSPGGVAAVTTPLATVAPAKPTATVDPTQVKQVMDSIVAKTTNFLGDPNATVTLIEFSDYQ